MGISLNWILLSVTASFLWACANIIDKFTLSKLTKETVIVLTFLPNILFIFLPFIIPISFSGVALLSGILWFSAFILYFYALYEAEASKVIILLAAIPITTAIISALLLGEVLSTLQYIGIVIAVFGSALLTLENFKLNRWALLMILATITYSLSDVLAKIAIQDTVVLSAFTVERLPGAAIVALIFVLRNKKIQIRSTKITMLAVASGIFATIGAYLFITAYQYAFVSLVTALETVQPFFVLVMAAMLAKINPKLLQEDISNKSLTIKISALVLLVIGVFLVAT